MKWPKLGPFPTLPHVDPLHRPRPTKVTHDPFCFHREKERPCVVCNEPTVWRVYTSEDALSHGPWLCSDDCYDCHKVVMRLEGLDKQRAWV